MWLYAWQLRTASNRLDARQSEIFTNFSQKASFKPRESIWCLFRNAKGLKNYFGCVVGGIFLCAHPRGVIQISDDEDFFPKDFFWFAIFHPSVFSDRKIWQVLFGVA